MSTKRKTCPKDIYQSAVAKKVAALAAEPNLVVHVGDVGYTFRKEFNAGWFRGVVVEIREGAEKGLDRRCYYEDGDYEDLSVSQLKKYALLDPEVKKTKQNVPAARAAMPVKVECNSDDNAERPTTISSHRGISHKKYKANPNVMHEKMTKDDAEQKDRHNIQPYIPHKSVSHSHHLHEIESARNANLSTSIVDNGTVGETSQLGFRKSRRQPKPPQWADEIYTYEHVKQVHHKQMKRLVDRPSPDMRYTLDYDIPVDEAALSTLHSSDAGQMMPPNDNDFDEDENEGWLEKVAVSLGAESSSKRFARSTPRVCNTSSIDGRACTSALIPGHNTDAQSIDANMHVSSGTNDNNSQQPPPEPAQAPQPPCDSESFPLLSECPVKSYYGCLVFHKEDVRRRVGEVIVEQDKPWVKVIMDGVRKICHVAHLIVVPSQLFKVGDWTCEKCKECNDGRYSACQSCNTTKSDSPERSIFFGVSGEVVMSDRHDCQRVDLLGDLSSGMDCESVGLDTRDQPLSYPPFESQSKQNCQGIIATIAEVMPTFLSKVHRSQVNKLGWTINSIEDDVVCGERTPFPIGIKFRKFFPGYGFHDGRILKVVRKCFVDSDKNEKRPALVYRCKYNDDDEEELLHHEIASLCQIYDKRNVSPEAPPRDQIPPRTVFETLSRHTIEIVCHKTPSGSKNDEGGTVVVKFHGCMKGKEFNLTDLQLAILRKVGRSLCRPNSTIDDRSEDASQTETTCQSSSTGGINMGQGVLASSPVLEWPMRSQKDENEFDITKGLKLHRKRCHANFDDDNVVKFPTNSVVNNPADVRLGCSLGQWDPAGCSDYLTWDPYDSTVCQICSIDKDDNQVVICESCHNGFHMYCVRPVMVNIPKGDWLCSACSGRSNPRVSFDEFSLSINEKEVFQFLGLPYSTAREFFTTHADAIMISSLISPTAVKQHATSQRVPANDAVFGNDIKFNRNIEKNDWCLPMPLTSEEDYMLSLSSIFAAMKFSGMTSNLYDLAYGGIAEANMNDHNLEVNVITPMSKRNLEIFRAFEYNIRKGVYPPIQIVYDENLGFSVKALAGMQRHTLIAQYLGEVTMDSQSSSDSLMILLDTGDTASSLIIDPSRVGNFARFLSGINNGKLASKRKINVRTRRFEMDGKMHVCLFTSRRVEAGEILQYDYNAGHEGKDSRQWAETGFYDTSNFV